MVQESTNTFSDGLISDLSSLTTPNTVLTDALNATLLTFNGNELVLQNDMGNTKIMVPGTELNPEFVQLPEGFIPIGMKEHGGVLYIVSTNGQEIEIGSFPSLPEAEMGTIYKTKLTTATNNTARTSISVENTTNFPASGTILIGETSVNYISKTSTSFTFASKVIPSYIIGTEVSVTSAFVHITGPGNTAINLGEIVGGVAINLNKNFIISDKLNSGEKFLIVLNTENLDTISSNIAKKYYKPKLLSIEKGIETDITNTLILQEKKVGNTFNTTNHWFLPLINSEYSTFNKSDYINNKKYQIYKPKKGGSLALRFELETINSFTLQNLSIVGNNLQFDLRIFAESLIKPNKITLNYNFIYINTGQINIPVSAELLNEDGGIMLDEENNELYSESSIIDQTSDASIYYNSVIKTDFIFENGVSTPSISIPLLDNYGNLNLNRIIEFTIACENTTYGINFNKFVIKRTVDLSKEDLNWTPTILYKAENVFYTNNGIITQIIIAKYGDINGVVTPMDRYNQPCVSSESQAAYYWNILPDGANDSLITDKRYDIVGTFEINNSTKKAENPLSINGIINENPLSSSNPNNLPQDILVTDIQQGYLYNSAVITSAKDIAIAPWRVPDYNDFYEIIRTINELPFKEKELLITGLEWDDLGKNSTKFNALKRGMFINGDLVENAVSWFHKMNLSNPVGSFNITKFGIDITGSDNYGVLYEAQGSCIRLCSDTGGNYTDLDGNTYQSVKIGNLYWLTRDLKTTKFNDNTLLNHVLIESGWADVSTIGSPAYTPTYTDFIIS